MWKALLFTLCLGVTTCSIGCEDDVGEVDDDNTTANPPVTTPAEPDRP